MTAEAPTGADAVREAEALRRAGRETDAIEALREAAAASEVPTPEVALALARALSRGGDPAAAGGWALEAVRGTDDLATWQAAATVLARHGSAAVPSVRRSVTLALAGSSTTSLLAKLLPVAAARWGIDLSVVESDYGQYRQDVLDPASALHRAQPDIVVLAVHDTELRLPELADDPPAAVEAEAARWRALWEKASGEGSSRVVQFGFAVPPERPLGHLTRRVPGSRAAMIHALNAALAESAGSKVSFVDCEEIAALVGKSVWFDPRSWHVGKLLPGPIATPALARHLAAVVAADLGLTRKCVVLDLDNTLWGGVIGEDGLGGIRLGGGAAGEGYVAFQEHLLSLQRRGVLLAVVSKNNEADAREPFLGHPDMRLALDDFAVFLATWEPKHEQLAVVAERLGLGLDSLVFVDDNPVERELARRFCPDVAVVDLPDDPMLFSRTLSATLLFEPAALTDDDRRRSERYRARSAAQEAAAAAESLDDFLDELGMVATVAPIDDVDLARVVQLIGKTNQFNLTTRRHGHAQVEAIAADPRWIHLTFRLADRFTDHGLVGVALGRGDDEGDAVEIDTLLLSCRVLGRTLEATMLHELAGRASVGGYGRLVGRFVPTDRNEQVATFYERFGFDLLERRPDGESTWELRLDGQPLPPGRMRVAQKEPV